MRVGKEEDKVENYKQFYFGLFTVESFYEKFLVPGISV